MRFHGALLRGQGQTFAIVIVKSDVLGDQSRAAEMVSQSQPIFPGVPIVLMAQDSAGRPAYFGRRDIVSYLASVPFGRIPWREYEFA